MRATGKKDKDLKTNKERILVVDDEKMIRWSLGEALRGWGFEPIEAATAGAGLAAFEAEPPAAVLLDINLPDGSGLDVLRKIASARAGRGDHHDHGQRAGRRNDRGLARRRLRFYRQADQSRRTPRRDSQRHRSQPPAPRSKSDSARAFAAVQLRSNHRTVAGDPRDAGHGAEGCRERSLVGVVAG